ncbi:hypothetical protein [Tunturiibacter gelidoferens]|uniref:Uncharacterized protein n=1 Tax=Tunturiibacter gelidiferens TaxID=3069689 RepID=A0ACC5NV51_9BACT|nr:hypothetical protein [Edaphobacter lichenicola]MBB5338442.1 hypothetical protein [Edaphobacter lichenicola]
MLSQLVATALFLLGSGCSQGQSAIASKCAPQPEFAPKLVDNPNRVVTFRCQGTALDLIESAGRQARIPIGLVLDARQEIIFHTKRQFDLIGADAASALREAIRETGYELKQEGDVLVIVPVTLTDRQRNLLALRLTNFKTLPGSTMFDLGLHLNMWLRDATNPMTGYNLSHPSSNNEEQFTFAEIPSATTQEIANRIVQLGSKGMWVLRLNAGEADGRQIDTLEIEPYQHHSNRPVVVQ